MSVLIIERHQGICKLILNRPKQMNSLTESMCGELQDALGHAATDSSVRCVLMTGSGRGFCAGQDLSEVGIDSSEPADLGLILQNNINPVVSLMRNMDKPVVVAVNGVAAGAGANIALSGDLVIATRSARFLQAFRHVGLIPDAGGTWLLPRLVGDARALGMAILGEPISADEAESMGLIWKCVDDDAFENVVESLSEQVAQGPTTAFALAKRAMKLSWNNSFEQQLELEREFQRAAAAGEDYREGVKAFLEKRRPSFQGR